MAQASFNFMTAVTDCSDFGAQENKVCHCFHFSLSLCHEVMGPDAMILVFKVVNFKPAVSLSSFNIIPPTVYIQKTKMMASGPITS